MSGKLIIMGGMALVFGATSYFAGNQYLDSQTQARISEFASNQKSQPTIELNNVVVAKAELKFGQRLEKEHLKVISWPAEHMPEGSFKTIEELTGKNARRVVTALQPGEPLLIGKVTGMNGRGGLAGIIAEGMRAVTIPVNLVDGVGGFVEPGDRVDIVFTHEDPDTDEASARIIMSNVKVLSVDQDAGQRSRKAHVAKSVTLETDAKGAQKLALARNIGKMSLLLRAAGDDQNIEGASMSSDELHGKSMKSSVNSGKLGGLFSFLNGEEEKKKVTSIRVVNRDVATDVTVPIEEVTSPEGAKKNEK